MLVDIELMWHAFVCGAIALHRVVLKFDIMASYVGKTP